MGNVGWSESSAMTKPTSDLFARDEFQRFLGTWVDDDGEIVCEIHSDDSGNLRIEPPQASEWKIEIRNVRAEGPAIFFDQYHFTPSLDGLKSPASPSGDHPFSGVRCAVELMPVDGDRDKLRYTMSAPQLNEPFATILKREETVQDVP